MFTLFGKNFKKAETKLAEAISEFAGSMFFVYAHVVFFAAWIIFGPSLGDPFPFGLLTMVVSLEAIFLATFILVNQNRQEEFAEERAREDEEQDEDIEEELEDIQEDFDSLREDIDEMRTLISRLEGHLAQRSNVPLNLPKEEPRKTSNKSVKKEKVSV